MDVTLQIKQTTTMYVFIVGEIERKSLNKFSKGVLNNYVAVLPNFSRIMKPTFLGSDSF